MNYKRLILVSCQQKYCNISNYNLIINKTKIEKRLMNKLLLNFAYKIRKCYSVLQCTD